MFRKEQTSLVARRQAAVHGQKPVRDRVNRNDRTPARCDVRPVGGNMDTNTLLIILVVLVLLGGGGFFYRRRV
jgi:LPXTG-motif cell wall-anchored protein